jgi:hypothetical protein
VHEQFFHVVAGAECQLFQGPFERHRSRPTEAGTNDLQRHGWFLVPCVWAPRSGVGATKIRSDDPLGIVGRDSPKPFSYGVFKLRDSFFGIEVALRHSEIRLVGRRDGGVFFGAVFMRVLATDVLRPAAEDASIGFGRGPNSGENAFVLDRELELQGFALVVGVGRPRFADSAAAV